MKNPASSIALIFPMVGLILLSVAGFMYYQGANTPEIDTLELWLGPAIAGGTGVIFLAIGAVLYFALREPAEDEQQQNKMNMNPHDLP